ncbi:MAG TPA: ABC transporter ATP-binding protein [Candidatus Saccharibacteria bacterium]|nr:ABC transporter ATP-binding protein [Candidatus Saccharibacteria bacterium]
MTKNTKQNKKQTYTKETLNLFWHYSKPYSFRRWFSLINSSVTTLSSAFIGPLVIAGILSSIQAGTIALASSWTPLLLFIGTQAYGEIIGWRLNLFATWTFETAAQRDLYHDIFKKLSSETLDFHANRFGGSLVSQAGKINGAFERFWDTVIFQVVPSLTAITAAIVILWQIFWQYAVILLIVSVLFIGAVIIGSRFLRTRNTEEAQASTKMTGWLADMVTNITTVKSYAGETQEIQQASEVSRLWRQKSLATMRGFLLVSSVYSTLGTILTSLALIAAIVASEQQLISIATVYLALTYTFTVTRQLWEMNSIMRNYNRVIGDAHDMVEILATNTKLNDMSSTPLVVRRGSLSIKNMSFTHDNGAGVSIFKNFSLAIPAGQRVGLVGHSGSGKSSLVRLLLRFSDIDQGSIHIDKQDISDVTQTSLRKAIAYVPQEPLLFHRSLRENIRYGKPAATDDEVVKAAKLAHAHEFIDRLSNGYDTLVGERGIKLSGGQRQRIAIARAILKDAPILVLDEATSALDSESEKLIQASLEHLMKGRTSIVIAHRLSTIAKLDRIVVLDNGRIIEDGTHVELLKKNGVYAKLWTHQSGGFIEE